MNASENLKGFHLDVIATVSLKAIVEVEKIAALYADMEMKETPLLTFPEFSEKNYDFIFTKICQENPLYTPPPKTGTLHALLYKNDQCVLEMHYNKNSRMLTIHITSVTGTLSELGNVLKNAGVLLESLGMCVATNTLIDDIKVGVYFKCKNLKK